MNDSAILLERELTCWLPLGLIGLIEQREPNWSIVSNVSPAVFTIYQDICTKHGPKLTQTSLISKPRVVFHISVIIQLSIGIVEFWELYLIIKKQTHSLIKLVFINKVIAGSPGCNMKKEKENPEKTQLVCCQLSDRQKMDRTGSCVQEQWQYSEQLIKTEEFFSACSHWVLDCCAGKGGKFLKKLWCCINGRV